MFQLRNIADMNLLIIGNFHRNQRVKGKVRNK